VTFKKSRCKSLDNYLDVASQTLEKKTTIFPFQSDTFESTPRGSLTADQQPDGLSSAQFRSGSVAINTV